MSTQNVLRMAVLLLAALFVTTREIVNSQNLRILLVKRCFDLLVGFVVGNNRLHSLSRNTRRLLSLEESTKIGENDSISTVRLDRIEVVQLQSMHAEIPTIS